MYRQKKQFNYKADSSMEEAQKSWKNKDILSHLTQWDALFQLSQ